MDPTDDEIKAMAERSKREVEAFSARHPGLVNAEIEAAMVKAHPTLPAGEMTPREYLEALLKRVLH